MITPQTMLGVIVKIRFRYNALFMLSCVLGTVVFIQHTQIQKLTKTLSDYAKVKDIRARSQYVNHNVTEIDIRSRDALSLARAAYDMASEKMSKDEWMVGLTTEEVDSIRLNNESIIGDLAYNDLKISQKRGNF